MRIAVYGGSFNPPHPAAIFFAKKGHCAFGARFLNAGFIV